MMLLSSVMLKHEHLADGRADRSDSLGVPLKDTDRVHEILHIRGRNANYIEDPLGIQLYCVIGKLKKSGHHLNTYRCARGLNSLDSFHLNRFISGTHFVY